VRRLFGARGIASHDATGMARRVCQVCHSEGTWPLHRIATLNTEHTNRHQSRLYNLGRLVRVARHAP
jgi:hypothetical protein